MSTEYDLTNKIPHWPGIDPAFREGLIGATFGDIAVSSPNMQIMYMPIYGHERSLFMRQDARFGVDDPMVCPQIFVDSIRYQACAPAPTVEHDYRHLFQPWQDEWFEPLEGYGGDVGKMKPEITQHFKVESRRFDKEYARMEENIKYNDYPGISWANFNTQKMQDDVYWRRTRWIHCSKTGTLFDLKLRFVNAQRHEFNLRSRISEQLIYGSRMKSMGSVLHDVDKTRMGAMTTNFNTALTLYFAGLPVYYLYSAKVANPANFKRYLSDSEVRGMQECNEIPPRPYQMGAYGKGYHPELAFLTGGKQPFFARTPLSNSKELWKGPAGHPKRYEIMTQVISRFRNPLKSIQDVTSGDSTTSHAQTRPFVSSPKRDHALLPNDDSVRAPPMTPAPSDSSASPAQRLGPSDQGSVIAKGSSSSLKRVADSAPAGAAPQRKKRKHAKGKKKESATAATTVNGAVVSAKPHQDRSHFDDIVSDFMPPSIPSCQTALSKVGAELKLTNREVPTLPGVSIAFSGYVFPEAAMLANLRNSQTRTIFLVNMVRLLPILEYNVDRIEDAKEDYAHVRPNVWRNVLAGSETTHKHGTIAADKREAFIQSFTGMLEESGLPPTTVNLRCLSSIPAVWCGVELAAADTQNKDLEEIHTEVCRELIWFANEVNWRTDLLALDAFLFNSSAAVGDEAPKTPHDRRTQVIRRMEHWDGAVMPSQDAVGNDVGFALDDLHQRNLAVLNLVDVMRDWTRGGVWCSIPDELCELKKVAVEAARKHEPPDLEQLNKLEAVLWEFYVRSYVHVFARAPSLPRYCRLDLVTAS